MIEVESILSDQDEMVCRLGLLIYSGRDGVLATINPAQVPEGGGAPLLMPGDCLTHDQLRALNDRLAYRAEVRRILPPEVLVADQDLVVWHRPARRKVVFFETRSAEFDRQVDGQMALHPALVFLGRPKSLQVFALASNGRPGPDTPLCRAPYLNIYGGGAMCNGTAPIPAHPTPSAESIAEYEAAFFESAFAHTALGDKEMTTYPGGHNGLWKALVASDHSFFPNWALVPAEVAGKVMTLSQAVESKFRAVNF